MARVKIGKLLLFACAFYISASAELLASTDSAPPANTSFAYSISHAVTPLPDAVLEQIADQEGSPFDFSDGSDGLDITQDDPVDVRVGPPRTLSQSGLCSAVVSVARANNLPIPFFANLIWQESNFDTDTISRAGAQGIAQFMPKTAVEFGLINPFEPIHALNVAGKFVRELYVQFGNAGLAAAAYNAGPRRVINWIAKRGELPGETRKYVLRITGRPAEAWTSPQASTDPETNLMPAKAPCVEVAEAVKAQAEVVRISKLVSELAQATTPPAHDDRETAKNIAKTDKPHDTNPKVANVKPDPKIQSKVASATSDRQMRSKMARAMLDRQPHSKVASAMPDRKSRSAAGMVKLALKETREKESRRTSAKNASKTAGKGPGNAATKLSGKSALKVAAKEMPVKAVAKPDSPRRHAAMRRTRLASSSR
jgi:hypothetical protein